MVISVKDVVVAQRRRVLYRPVAFRQILLVVCLATMDNLPTCCTCKKPIVGKPVLVSRGKPSSSGGPAGKDTLRCCECHSCRSRLETLWGRKPLLKNKWQGHAMSSDERLNFINEAKNLFGAELELLVERTIDKRLIHTKEDLDQLEVEWLDEKDLAERFKDRPDKKEKNNGEWTAKGMPHTTDNPVRGPHL